MADDRLDRMAKLKALQQLRLAREQAELGGHVARTKEAADRLHQEEDLLASDEARQFALLSGDGFDPGELRLAGLVLAGQQETALVARHELDGKQRQERQSRQAVAICEAQSDKLEDALRKTRRKAVEKAEGALAVELLARGSARKAGDEG